MNINPFITERINFFFTLSKNQLQESISNDTRFQTALAYLVEKNQAYDIETLLDLIENLNSSQSVPETLCNLKFIDQILKHENLIWLARWHKYKITNKLEPNPEILFIMEGLLASDTQTIETSISLIKPYLKELSLDLKQQQTINIINNPFLLHLDLQRDKSPGFENNVYNRLYWVNAIIFKLWLNEDYPDNMVLFSTYLDIILHAIVEKYDGPLKVNTTNKQQMLAFESIQSHLCQSDPLTKKMIAELLHIVNHKRFMFGLLYFEIESIRTIIDVIYIMPNPKIRSNSMFKSDHSSHEKINYTKQF